MKIVEARPPFYKRIVDAIGEPGKGTVFCYGDTVYSPDGPPTPDVLVHESVHVEQQSIIGGPHIWWDRYLEDPAFRLEQELEAYQAQMRFLSLSIKDRNYRVRTKLRLANVLAGPLYGKLITASEAFRRLP